MREILSPVNIHMRITSLFSALMVFALVCSAQEPRPTPISTPRVIILLEKDRHALERGRASADKDYRSGKIDKDAYGKCMKEYKAGIEKYRAETKAAGRDK
jgi:hypothetical protein